VSIIDRGFYNLNAVRGYPIDDIANRKSDAGDVIPDGIITDLCLRFPESLGHKTFISSINTTQNIVSVIINVVPEYDPSPVTPIAAATVAKSAVIEGKPYRLTGILPGVDGWIVFGNVKNINYQGRFSSYAQSLLLTKVSKPYKALPLTAVKKLNTTQTLVGDVDIISGFNITIDSDYVHIDGLLRPAMLFSLENKTSSVLTSFTGPCGARPESGTCIGTPIQQINDVIPDSDGNITITITNGQVTNVPYGLIVNATPSLPGLCGNSLVNIADTSPFIPRDQCSEPLIISETIIEISESEIPPTDVVSESINCTSAAWPIAQVFTQDPAHPTQIPPFKVYPDQLLWPWNFDLAIPAPVLANFPIGLLPGQTPKPFTCAPVGGPAGNGVFIGCGLLYAIFDDDCRVYKKGDTMTIETMFIFYDFVSSLSTARGGIVFGAKTPTTPSDCHLPLFFAGIQVGRTNPITVAGQAHFATPAAGVVCYYDGGAVPKQLSIVNPMKFNFTALGGIPNYAPWNNLPAWVDPATISPANAVYKVTVTLTPSTKNPDTLVNVSTAISTYAQDIANVKLISMGTNTIVTPDVPNILDSDGRFGLGCLGTTTTFCYFRVTKH